MGATLDEMKPATRAYLLDLWIELGFVLFGNARVGKDRSETPRSYRQACEQLSKLRKEASAKPIPVEKEEEAPPRKVPHKCTPGKMTHRIKQRMFDLFVSGMSANEVYAVLHEEFGPLRFKKATVGYWLTKWHSRKSDQSGSVPAQPDVSRPQAGGEREPDPSGPAAGAAGPIDQAQPDPVPRPMFAQVSPEARRWKIRPPNDEDVAAWKQETELVECLIPGARTVSRRTCEARQERYRHPKTMKERTERDRCSGCPNWNESAA